MPNYDKSSVALDRLKQSLNDPQFCDVLVVDRDGGRTHCMSWALCSSSEVFNRMLRSEFKEGANKEVHITDVDPDALKQMLEGMHNGVYEITPLNYIPMNWLADKYNVRELSACCEKFKEEDFVVDDEVCCTYLRQALAYKMDEIVDECMHYIVEEMGDVCERPEFGELSHESICLLKAQAMKKGGGGEKHVNAYTWFIVGIIKWVEKDLQCRREYLGPLLCDMDFTCLTINQIAHLCSYESIQSSSELVCIISKCLGKKGSKAPTKTSMCSTYKPANVHRVMKITSTGWYRVIAQGGYGAHSPCTGARVEGSAHLKRGDRIMIVVGKSVEGGGGGGCLVSLFKPTEKCWKHLVIAGGGGQCDIRKRKWKKPEDIVPYFSAQGAVGGQSGLHSGTGLAEEWELSFDVWNAPFVTIKRQKKS